MVRRPKIVGKIVYVVDADSIYFGEWGRVIKQDYDNYYIAIADGRDAIPVFSRDQFRIKGSGHNAKH